MRPPISYLLYEAILLARKDPLYRVYLYQLQNRRKNPEMVFSWMQWADAKRWFSSGSDGAGIYYLLKMEHRDKTPTEIYNELKRYYE